MKYIMLAFMTIVLICNVKSQDIKLPWLKELIEDQSLDKIQTIFAEANVTVSDGLTYKVKTLYHDNQRAVFHRTYSDKIKTSAIEGKYIWEFDGTKEVKSKAFMGGIILGHQFFAKILFFNKMHPGFSSPENARFSEHNCKVISAKNENTEWKFYYQEKAFPFGMELIPVEGSKVVFNFSNWKNADGIKLPYKIVIDDGSRKFDYNFSRIEFNKGSIKDFRAPENVLTDKQKLLRLHRDIMDDHLFERTETMAKATADSMYILSEGEIYDVSKKQTTNMLKKIMSNRNYTVYDDLVMPRVKISDDGSLGWVIAQIGAKGVRLDENRKETGSLEFVCAWIELYEKVNGKWLNIGNVSNFKPDRK